MSIAVRQVRVSSGVDVPVLVSTRMPTGFRHGFTMRAGGTSRAPFDTLNLGWKWGDAPERIAENHRRLLAAADATSMFRLSQVHGARIVRVRRDDDPIGLSLTEGDGLCTDEAGVGLSVHVADCTPILMACAATGACAALHAGWRGTAAGMAYAGVERMRTEFGCEPKDLHVVLGPCIGRCCFEVGPEVASLFEAAMAGAREDGIVAAVPGRKPHVDLRRFQRQQLLAAGVPPDQIDASDACTVCDPDRRFFSFRKAGRATGQSVGFVVRI